MELLITYSIMLRCTQLCFFSHEDDDQANNEMEEDSLDSKLHDAVEAAEQLISAQIKSLEILTNLCSGDDTDSEEYSDKASCSEESLDGEGFEESFVTLNPDLKKALIEARLFQLVIEKAQLPAANIVEALVQYRPG